MRNPCIDSALGGVQKKLLPAISLLPDASGQLFWMVVE